MIVDIIAVALLVLAIFKGTRNGLIVAVFSFLSFFIGLAAALKLSAVVADYLSESTNISQRWLPVLAFAIVFFVVVLLVRLGAKALETAMSAVMLGWLNKLGGIVFYILLYLFIFSIVLFYATQLNIIKPATIDTSVTYPVVYPIAPEAMKILGGVIPWFKDMFAELENFFGNLSPSAS